MTSLLNKAVSVAAMTMQDKVTLFNTQEHLNGILTHSDSERLVCERADRLWFETWRVLNSEHRELSRLWVGGRPLTNAAAPQYQLAGFTAYWGGQGS